MVIATVGDDDETTSDRDVVSHWKIGLVHINAPRIFSAADVVRRWIDLFNAADPDGLAELYLSDPG